MSVRQPFAIGKYEVTRGQFSIFVKATEPIREEGCDGRSYGGNINPLANWLSPGFPQSENDPVVCVSYENAKAYTRWLSRKTGHAYRLPSEAEWEYAARAGTRTVRPWGDSANEACGYANVFDRTSKRVNKFDYTPHSCDDGQAHTSPVGKFKAIAFGLHDMLGNVWEWTEDCWNDDYVGAPSDTSVWEAGRCGLRITWGASWLSRI